MGIRKGPTRYPTPASSRKRIVPSAAASPKALPPESTTAWTRSTVFSGSSRSVSRVPGAEPRTSTPATAPSRARTTVHPVGQAIELMLADLDAGNRYESGILGKRNTRLALPHPRVCPVSKNDPESEEQQRNRGSAREQNGFDSMRRSRGRDGPLRFTRPAPGADRRFPGGLRAGSSRPGPIPKRYALQER